MQWSPGDPDSIINQLSVVLGVVSYRNMFGSIYSVIYISLMHFMCSTFFSSRELVRVSGKTFPIDSRY